MHNTSKKLQDKVYKEFLYAYACTRSFLEKKTQTFSKERKSTEKHRQTHVRGKSQGSERNKTKTCFYDTDDDVAGVCVLTL